MEEQVAEATQKPKKADVTRRKIVEAAMELFHENGYDETTMRLIAQRAGVSVGNAYYYFPSKEALIQGYYHRLYEQFAEACEPVLRSAKSFPDRLSGVMLQWVEVARPYHGFASSFFRYAADPKSPTSPFSPESAPSREATTGIFRQVVEGSHKLKGSDEVMAILPQMLWLFHMGIVLFWVYDDSADQVRTRTLVKGAVPVIDKLVGLSRIPVLRSNAADIVELIGKLTTVLPAAGQADPKAR